MRTVIFIGDSLIEYFDWMSRFPSLRAVNLGIGGETVGDLLERIPSVIGRYPEVDAVFIMSGINDIAMEAPGFIAEYREILSTLRAAYPRAEIYVTSLLPTMLPWIEPGQITETNAHLKRIAPEHGAIYMNVFDRFIDQGIARLLSPDGIHLSGIGYAVWSAEVENALGPVEVG